MRRSLLLVATTAFFAVVLIGTVGFAVLLTLSAGCEKRDDLPVRFNQPNPGAAQKQKVPIAGAPGATLTGVVTFDGDPPVANPRNQLWIVNKNGGVANVVLSLRPPEDKEYANGVVQKETVVLDHTHPAFVPHVVAVQADVQPLVVKNTGKMKHNTKISSNPKYNEPTDEPLDPERELGPKKLKFEPTPISIACSTHSFMTAKLLIFDHPYFAVTDEQGRFSIANIPVGEEFTIHIWHESMGDKGKNHQKVIFRDGDAKVIEMKIK